MHLELFLVGILTPCALVFGDFTFFSSEAPEVFFREDYVVYVNPCRVLVVV
jgi:hypothetical protein